MVDTLHQTDQGVFVHLMDSLRKKLGMKLLKKIEKRMLFLKDHYGIGSLQLPSPKIWTDGINIQGHEHRAVMQVTI